MKIMQEEFMLLLYEAKVLPGSIRKLSIILNLKSLFSVVRMLVQKMQIPKVALVLLSAYCFHVNFFMGETMKLLWTTKLGNK